MSLAIEVDTVTDVLLADGWHKVVDASFALDAYEYTQEGRAVRQGPSADGAAWRERDGALVCCPVTAILAVKMVPERRPTGLHDVMQPPPTPKRRK